MRKKFSQFFSYKASNGVWIMALYLLFLGAIMLTAQAVLAVEIPNPIKARSFEELVINLAKAIQIIAFVLAPVFIIIAGFKFITAATSGNASGVTNARKMFLWILVGTAIVVGASALAQAVVNFAREL